MKTSESLVLLIHDQIGGGQMPCGEAKGHDGLDQRQVGNPLHAQETHKFATFCEFGTLVGIIGDFRVSMDFFLNGDARLGSGLLKYNICRGKS